MDANTSSVLKAVLDIVSIIVTALMVVYVAKSNNKMDKVNTKVDEYHNAVNGNMEKLLEKTADLATANEKARGKEEDKKSKK